MFRERVLVVDFDAFTKNFIRTWLSQKGFLVVSLDSFNHILSYLKKKTVEILLVNLTMPEFEAIELIRRARFIRPGIGIIVMSQKDSRDSIIRAFQEGVNNILEKPFDEESLIKTIDEVLERGRLAKENVRLKTLLPLFKLTESLVSELRIDRIFDDIVRLVYIETRASKVVLMMHDENTNALTIKAATGITKDQLGKNISMTEDSIAWAVMKTRKPIVINSEKQGKVDHNEMSTLCVPLSIKSKTIGVINCHKTGDHLGFSEGDLELLTILAGQATIAIENAQLFSDTRKQQVKLEASLIKVLTAQEDERTRISADLHDGLAQWLVSASYCMQMGEVQMTLSQYEKAKGELNRANDIVSQSVKELRRILLDLHPVALSELGLVGALQQSITYFNRENGVRCDLNIAGTSKKLSFISDVTIYRVILESLNNIRKHSQAHHARITVAFKDDVVAVNIVDDGIGFDCKEIANRKVMNGSLGLVTMKERTEMIGGTFKLDSRPGSGTRIDMKIPASV